MLISFLQVRIQNNSTGFDVKTWQWESDSVVCSFMYRLSPVNCWLCAPKILLNLESSILVNPMALGPGFAHVWCHVCAVVPPTGPLCLHRATLWASQREMVLGIRWGWAALPIPGSLACLLCAMQLPSEQKLGTCCRATFKLLVLVLVGFFWGVCVEVRWHWVEKAPYHLT